jgi:hypothetical protein
MNITNNYFLAYKHAKKNYVMLGILHGGNKVYDKHKIYKLKLVFTGKNTKVTKIYNNIKSSSINKIKNNEDMVFYTIRIDGIIKHGLQVENGKKIWAGFSKLPPKPDLENESFPTITIDRLKVYIDEKKIFTISFKNKFHIIVQKIDELSNKLIYL